MSHTGARPGYWPNASGGGRTIGPGSTRVEPSAGHAKSGGGTIGAPYPAGYFQGSYAPGELNGAETGGGGAGGGPPNTPEQSPEQFVRTHWNAPIARKSAP